MARWKARADFLLTVNELPFLSLTVDALQGKTSKLTAFWSGWVGQFEPRFQGEGVIPREYFLVSRKTRHILLADSVNCTVLRAAVLTQYRPVTDGRTDRQSDGRNCYS